MNPVADILAANPVLLAPMAGVTEAPFRGICKGMGAGLTYTEMVSAKGLHYNPDSRVSRSLLTFSPAETPCAVQLFGSEPEVMAAQAANIVARYGNDVALIDINMGCPVTVKFRSGWDSGEINAPEFARAMEAAGAHAMAVHGRTREQFYKGEADWNVIAAVKAAVDVPVIGSGDVLSPDDVASMLDRTGVDAVMVARGAQGYPWIFREAQALLAAGTRIAGPTPYERVDVAREHARALHEFGGEYTFARMRKHVAWYIVETPGATYVRARAYAAKSMAEIDELLLEYREFLGRALPESDDAGPASLGEGSDVR